MKAFFLSSTLKDMRAERDILASVVLPELNEYARECGQTVKFIDLCWGRNTQELASGGGSKKVQSVFRDEIYGSRPYMIVLVGDRYGFLPSEKFIKAAVDEKIFSANNCEKNATEAESEYSILSNPELLNRCIFYFRGTLPYDKMSQSDRAVYITEDYRERELLTQLRGSINISGATVKFYSPEWNEEEHRIEGLETFAQMVIDDVKDILKGESENGSNQSWQEKEAIEAEILARDKRNRFSSRYDLLKKYLQQIQSDDTRMFILRGASGCGKSTMLARIENELSKEADTFFLACGNGLRSQSADDILRQIVYHLETRLGSPEHFDDEEKQEKGPVKTGKKTIEEWTERFMNLADEYSAKSRNQLYIVCDALEQLTQDENVRNFSWLPKALPSAVTMVFSCLDGIELPEDLPYKENSVVEVLKELNREEIPEAVEGMLSFAGKELDKNIKDAVKKKKNAVNPLYLNMLLQRLIMLDSEDFGMTAGYGSNGSDMAAINRYLLETVDSSPDTLHEMCRAIFEEAAERINKPLCLKVADLIAVSRRGLRETDFDAIFAAEGIEWNSLDFSRFFKYLRPYFVQREDGRIDFSHKEVREGIAETTDAENVNTLIFNQLKSLDFEDTVRLNEIIYHAQKADEKKFLVSNIEEVNSKFHVKKTMSESIRGSMFEYREKALKKSETIGKTVAEALHENAIDNSEWYKDFFSTATDNGAGIDFFAFCNFRFYKAFTKSTDELELLCIFMNNLCLASSRLAEKLKTLEAYQNLNVSYERIGEIYHTQRKYTKSLEIYKKQLEFGKWLVEERKDIYAYFNLAKSHNDLGDAYYALGKREEASEMYKKASEIEEWCVTEFMAKKQDPSVAHKDFSIKYKSIELSAKPGKQRTWRWKSMKRKLK